MKKTNLIILIAIFIIAMISCERKQEDGLKIGAILPLTGNIGYFGEYEKNALELFKKQNPDKNIKIIYEDSKNEPKTALNAYNKLVNIENVKCIITQMTSVSLALVPLLDQDEVFLFSLAMDTNYASMSNYAIRVYEDVAFESKTVSNYIKEHYGSGNVVVTYLTDAWGDYAKNSFLEEMKDDSNFKVKLVEFSFKTSPENIAVNILKEQPDQIYIIGYGPIIINILKKLKELKNTAQIFGNIGMSWDYILKNSGDAIEGCLIAMPKFIPEEDTTGFSKDYIALYGKNPNFESAYTYDLVNIIVQFMESKNKEFNIKSYKGVTGTIIINDNGNAKMKSSALRVVEQGKLKTVKLYEY